MRSTNDNPTDSLGSLGAPVRQAAAPAPDPVRAFERINDHSKALESVAETLRKKAAAPIDELTGAPIVWLGNFKFRSPFNDSGDHLHAVMAWAYAEVDRACGIPAAPSSRSAIETLLNSALKVMPRDAAIQHVAGLTGADPVCIESVLASRESAHTALMEGV